MVLQQRIRSRPVRGRRDDEPERVGGAGEQTEEEDTDKAQGAEDERCQAVRTVAAHERHQGRVAREDPAPEEDGAVKAAPERDRRVVARRLTAPDPRHVLDAEVVGEKRRLHSHHRRRHGYEGEVGGSTGRVDQDGPVLEASDEARHRGNHRPEQGGDHGGVAERAQHRRPGLSSRHPLGGAQPPASSSIRER